MFGIMCKYTQRIMWWYQAELGKKKYTPYSTPHTHILSSSTQRRKMFYDAVTGLMFSYMDVYYWVNWISTLPKQNLLFSRNAGKTMVVNTVCSLLRLIASNTVLSSLLLLLFLLLMLSLSLMFVCDIVDSVLYSWVFSLWMSIDSAFSGHFALFYSSSANFIYGTHYSCGSTFYRVYFVHHKWLYYLLRKV